MYCNKDIHEAITDMGEIICPFCNQELVQYNTHPPEKYCCDRQGIINNNSIRVCRFCGLVDGYENATEYVNFHENMYKIRRKSVYHRKYHIENVIYKANINISRNRRDKIYKLFDEIQKIVPSINTTRKRMISINFLIRQILMSYLPDVPYEDIKITKSKKTLEYYEKYWNAIIEMIGHKIKNIIQQ